MKYLYSLLLILMLPTGIYAQIAVKTNLLYDATATVNLGAEVAVAPQWSVELSGNLNAWTLSGEKRWKPMYSSSPRHVTGCAMRWRGISLAPISYGDNTT